MAQRILPGAYVSLNDMSQLPEGQTALTVGYVLKANRGPVNTLQMVTSPTDFLTKYTFSGKPGIEDDKTFWSILKVLNKTNLMYVSRAANYPLYGGTVLKKSNISLGEETILGFSELRSDSEDTRYFITIKKDDSLSLTRGDNIIITNNLKTINWFYTVVETTDEVITGAENTEVTKIEVEEAVPEVRIPANGLKVNFEKYVKPYDSLSMTPIADISLMNPSYVEFDGNVVEKLSLGCKFIVKFTGSDRNNETFTVETNEAADPIFYNEETDKTEVKVKEAIIPEGTGVTAKAYYGGLGNPDSFKFADESAASKDLLLITGIDAGSYNNDIVINVTTSAEFPDEFVYYKGAQVGGREITFDTIRLEVVNGNTNEPLEVFEFSRDPNAKTIDGISMYVDNVVSGSAYIKVINNEKAGYSSETGSYAVPSSTRIGGATLTGGDNGGDIDASILKAALEPFGDKLQTLSILGNGCSTQAETKEFQQALMGIANDRKDLVVFLNNPADTEKKTLSSAKAQAIVDYKKYELANTSFYGCMYAPHVNTSDTFNQRQVKIGAEAVAIAGWLDIIGNLGYPYAYAGPKNGLVQGVTCDWKIGDMSGEAQLLNDASVNYVAYDGKVGRYYMQCQNTLQVANSSMRNIGTVLNVLDIKEHFVTLLKEYLQLPITDDLRREIVDVSNDYLSPMLGVRFSNYAFQDVTKPIDLADNTLRFLLTIAPTPYAQKIYLTMNIVNATFDFSILQSM